MGLGQKDGMIIFLKSLASSFAQRWIEGFSFNRFWE